MENIFIRRSVRKYKEMQVEPEKVEKLLRAGMQAPSSVNQQPWEFIVVEDEDRLKELSQMSKYCKFVEKAPLAIVLLGNEDRMQYPENWEQDMGACAQNILLEAVELNLGAVWIGVYPIKEDISYIKDMFNLSDNIRPYCIISIGYPKDDNANKFIDRFDETRIHYDKR